MLLVGIKELCLVLILLNELSVWIINGPFTICYFFHNAGIGDDAEARPHNWWVLFSE